MLDEIHGEVEEAKASFLIRDFTWTNLKQKKSLHERNSFRIK